MALSSVWLLFLVSSITRFSVCLGQCEDIPSHVSSLVSLEQSILCDEYNIQSLTESFFPANRRQAIIVLVNYYMNVTQHPLAVPPGEQGNTTTLEPDHVFFWFSSSVLVFIEPRLLEGLSLRTYSAEYNYAQIRINAPFLYNDTNWIRGMLSNATIWLKSYAERRLTSIVEGVTLNNQGFSTYKPDIRRDDYFVYNGSIFYQFYVFLLALSFSFIVAFICITIPILILKYYKVISKLSTSNKHEHVSFKFHNLFWGLVVSMGIALAGIYAFSIWNISTFGFKWDTDYFFIYPALTVGIILIFVVGIIESFVVVQKISAANTLILLPTLLLRIFGVKSSGGNSSTNLIPVKGSAERTVTLLWQFICVFIVINTIVLASFFSCGILMALFIDSVQVITRFAIYVLVLLCLAHGFAALFEATDHVAETTHRTGTSKPILSSFGLYIKYFGIVIGLLLVTLFIGTFGLSFASIVFFAGTNDESLQVFSSVGELLPVALASIVGWLLRKEFQSYNNQKKDDAVNKGEQHHNHDHDIPLQTIHPRNNSLSLPATLSDYEETGLAGGEMSMVHMNQQHIES